MIVPAPEKSGRLRLRVKPAAETILRAGHPWVFASSIRDQSRPGRLGELAVIYDHRDRFLALGLFDPMSPIRVRVLHRGRPQVLDSAWWREQLKNALKLRDGLFDEDTTGFRWINGESDGWPGLVLDRYSKTLVCKLYSAAWLSLLGDILPLMRAQLKPERMVLRLSRNIQELAEKEFSKNDGALLMGSPPNSAVVFLESGLRFEAEVLRGQKTGFFLDQRENRRRVEGLATGRRVLNAFSFTGGFSLYAARGGARSVVDVDLSAHALESARRNFALNQSNARLAACSHELIQADVFAWLEQAPAQWFDLVILDPPSLAKRDVEKSGALKAYHHLATLGIECLAPGGILVACSCSAHVPAEDFFKAVRQAAARSKRRFEELQTTRHAPDHPAKIPEAQYLKAIYVQFSTETAGTDRPSGRRNTFG